MRSARVFGVAAAVLGSSALVFAACGETLVAPPDAGTDAASPTVDASTSDAPTDEGSTDAGIDGAITDGAYSTFCVNNGNACGCTSIPWTGTPPMAPPGLGCGPFGQGSGCCFDDAWPAIDSGMGCGKYGCQMGPALGTCTCGSPNNGGAVPCAQGLCCQTDKTCVCEMYVASTNECEAGTKVASCSDFVPACPAGQHH